MTEVSVIIPTYNRADRVTIAVSSVLAQTYTDFELIVVDDGSRDETMGALGPFLELIRVIRHERNLGVSAARNAGIRASRARFVSFLDSDDRWLPEKLEVQARFFQDQPEAVACQTQEIWIRGGRRVNPALRHLKPSGDIFEPSLERCLVSPSAVMLRRSLLEEVGLFNESLPVCEDYDLWLRIACRHPIHLIDRELLVREGGHPDQLSARGPGMDRYRIQALVGVLRSGRLSASQGRAALDALRRKSHIYAEGCLKRGRRAEGRYYQTLADRVAQGERFPFHPPEHETGGEKDGPPFR
jgi:glycosyltransferase involved in cell wall biosynthesis